MKNSSSCPARGAALLFRIILPLLLALWAPDHAKSQCFCNNNQEIDLTQNIGQSYFPTYNEFGELSTYRYDFQFMCIDLPMDLFALDDEYFYNVLYRKAGTNDPWQISETSVWNDVNDYLVSVPGLLPGVRYEFRINCPCAYPGCDASEQVANFFGGEPLNNVTKPWTNVYCPNDNWISNLYVSYMDLNNHSAYISWKYGVHPPGDVLLDYRLKTTPAGAWIELPNAPEGPEPQILLSNLDACKEYEFRVRVQSDCGEKIKTISFTMSDCSAAIFDIDQITGTSAHVLWSPNSQINPTSYTLTWRNFFNQIQSVSLPATEYTITGLSTTNLYTANITPVCPPEAQCPKPSIDWTFVTTCDPFEYNELPDDATPIVQDGSYSASINPAEDVDYYSVYPNCERIQVYIKHPYLFFGNGEYEETLANLGYSLMDENFVPVQKLFYADPVYPDLGHPYYSVIPDHKYYLKVTKSPGVEDWSLFYKQPCYNLQVRSCLTCYDNAVNKIEGYSTIPELPFEDNYGLYETPFFHSDLSWSIVSGPATLTLLPDPSVVHLSFDQPGTVVLAASVTRCDGAQMTYYKTIQIPVDPCQINGLILFAGSSQTQPLKVVNSLLSENYVVNLNLPPGSNFTWSLISGQATWTINSSSIKIHQSSGSAFFKLTRLNGECAGESRYFYFSLDEFAPGGDVESRTAAVADPEFVVTPNPVEGLLWVKPVEGKTGAEDEPAADCELELFDALSNRLLTKHGSAKEETSLDCKDLPSGQYFLRITGAGKVRTFPITKL